ncbi:MAG: hypothetical protein QG661_2170, partial [Actinomycetota bacterium]|nr:hypothetical protein [Actinomycetota bacterium]
QDARGMKGAQVAACDYTPAGWPDGTYTLVRRVRIEVTDLSDDPRSRRRRTVHKDQLALACDGDVDHVWSVSFIVTNIPADDKDLAGIEAWFRDRTAIEERFREAKHGAGLNHLPSADRSVNAVWAWAGLLAGPWFLGITVYLTKNAVVPLTNGSAWHGPADLIAVSAYLAGVIPLVGITLIELGILGRGTARARMRLHAIFVGIFLIAAHIAMIFGMLDPTLFGWTPSHTMPTGDVMPGMDM